MTFCYILFIFVKIKATDLYLLRQKICVKIWFCWFDFEYNKKNRVIKLLIISEKMKKI